MPRYEIRIAGFGGQGVITIGRIIGTAAVLYEKKNAVQTQSYGPESRGGACRADVVLADGDIHYPHVGSADVLVALSQTAQDVYLKILKPGGLLLVDPLTVTQNPPRSDARLVKVPTAEMAHAMGNKKYQNMVALGAFCQLTGMISPEALERAITAIVPSVTLPQNIEAFHRGMNYVRP
jgi:2-oxoglutarate ferredoxin oxidoreductase subunit gamma